MRLLGIDEETIEAFQSRVSNIRARHYNTWLPVLDSTYARALPGARRLLLTPGELLLAAEAEG